MQFIVQKQRSRYMIIFLVMIILIMQIIVPVQSVQASVLVAGGVAIVAAVLVMAGVMVASDTNLQGFAEQVYSGLSSAVRTSVDNLGGLVKVSGIGNVTIPMAIMQAITDAVKGIFGESPPATYQSSIMGNVVSSVDPYSSVISPVNVLAIPSLLTFGPSGVVSHSWTQGLFDITYSVGTGSHYITITCPDGKQYQLTMGSTGSSALYPGSYFYSGYQLMTPVLYDSDGTIPQLRFYIKGVLTANGVQYNYPEIINLSASMTLKQKSTDGLSWVTISGGASTVFSYLMQHTDGQTMPTANINTTTYNNVINNTYESDQSINVSRSLTDLLGMTSEQISATEAVSTNLLDMGSKISSAINTGVNAITGWLSSVWQAVIDMAQALGLAISDVIIAIQSLVLDIVQSIYDAIVGAFTYLFVPTVSLTSVSDAFLEKLGASFDIQTSFSREPLTVVIPFGEHQQTMTLNNSMFTQFRGYMEGFIYLIYAWFIYKKVVGIGGNE